MFKKEKKQTVKQEVSEKPTPAFLKDDYPFPAVGENITDIDGIADGEVYEIKCPQCQMAIRSQGKNIKATYARLKAGNGCLGCGNKEFIVKKVDMSKSTQA